MLFKMKFQLKRDYLPKGTNGRLTLDGMEICSTIELPWKDNLKEKSCIPEGEYRLEKRYSKKYGWHIELKDVPGRSLILFHPANYALSELRGCIAPVLTLLGEGVGGSSKIAFQRLKRYVYEGLKKSGDVRLLIKS